MIFDNKGHENDQIMKLMMKASLLALLLPVFAKGQETGMLRMNPDSAVSRTDAAIWGGVEHGWFRPTYEGPFQWKAGAEAKLVRHGKKTSWAGGLSLEQMMGQSMGSSMLLEPGYFPVDVLDVAEGTKSRQKGKLEAGFLTDLGYECAAGLHASAQVGHIAKQQGMKHSSFGMEAQLEPTVTYVMDDDMGLVSSYLVRVRTEQLKIAEADGIQPFLDLGLRIGAFENLGQFPILEFAHGFKELLYSPELTAEFGITWKRGRAGTPDYSRFQFPGSTLHAAVEQLFQADKADHVYRIAYRRDRDQLRNPNADGGGFTGLFGRHRRNLDLKYEIRFLHGAVKRIGVDLDGNRWVEEGLIISRSDAAKWFDGTATLLSSFSFGPVDLDLNFLAARGWWGDRGRLLEPEDTPGRMMNDWLRNMDYRTTTRLGVNGTITVHFSGVRGLYAQLYGSWNHAVKVVCVGGQNREIGTLRIGYQF